MDCAISTVARKHAYIHALLRNLQLDRPIRLVAGTPDSSFLDRYRSNPRFQVVELREADWNAYKDSNVHHRATFNYWRCLILGPGTSVGKGLLILEDDVIAAHGWQSRLTEVIHQIEARHGQRFVLALYSSYDFRPVQGTHYAVYPVSGFFGTQAIYYPEPVRPRFAEYLRDRGVEKNQAPYDLLLKDFLKSEGIPLLASVPALFQHVGKSSTGLGSFHQSPNFQKYLYPGMNPLKRLDDWVRRTARLKNALLAVRRKKKEKSRTMILFPNQTFQTDGMRVVHTIFNPLALRRKKAEWKAYIEKIPATPENFLHPRGIVICAGGVRFLTCAYINIQQLRKLGCTLPIEVWHLDHEISKELQLALKDLNVDCHNLREVCGLRLRSFQTKPFAILHSKFREVLFLDADNVATRDPRFIFDHPDYKKYGAVFWPDFWITDRRNPIWNLTDAVPDRSPEFDSGQILVDKSRCWKELSLACYFNQEAAFYYRLLNGDKDTFKFAWLALKTPFILMKHEVTQCGYVNTEGRYIGTTMVQHDFDGNILFLHRNLCKWDTTREGEIIWQELRKFKADAVRKEYYLNVDKYLSMVIAGDIDVQPFQSVFPDLERECLGFLKQLRESPMYARFLVENYIFFFRQGG